MSAVAYIHSRGVVHSDLGLHNYLLRDDGGIVLCDFAGSSLDGGRSYVAYGVRYANPLFTEEYPNEQEDIFALGTVLYELNQGERLFEGMSREEIYVRLRDRRFPDLSMVSLPLRGVIEKCWTVPGYKASDALKELGKSLFFPRLCFARFNQTVEPRPLITRATLSQALLGLVIATLGLILWKKPHNSNN